MKHTFKTNINCSGCVAKVTPFLDREEIASWEVDTEKADKILTVESQQLGKEEIMKLVKEAGFSIEEKSRGLFSGLRRKK